MTRIFGLIIGIGLCLQSASGALLVSHRFQTTSGSNTVTTTAATYDGILSSSEVTVSNFTNVSSGGNGISGSAAPGTAGNIDRYWQTGSNVNATFQTTKYNEYIVTNPGAGKDINISSISLSAWRGNADTNGVGRVSIQYSLDGGTNWNRWVTATNNNVNTFAADSAITVANQAAKPAQLSLSLSTPVTLTSQQSMKIRFIYDRVAQTGTGSVIAQFRLDDIQLFGGAQDIVPEPLSMATFGLVGAGLALVRRRKQS